MEYPIQRNDKRLYELPSHLVHARPYPPLKNVTPILLTQNTLSDRRPSSQYLNEHNPFYCWQCAAGCWYAMDSGAATPKGSPHTNENYVRCVEDSYGNLDFRSSTNRFLKKNRNYERKKCVELCNGHIDRWRRPQHLPPSFPALAFPSQIQLYLFTDKKKTTTTTTRVETARCPANWFCMLT